MPPFLAYKDTRHEKREIIIFFRDTNCYY